MKTVSPTRSPTQSRPPEEFLSKRKRLDPSERVRHSSLIRQRIFQHPAWKKASHILCYVSFGSEVEPTPSKKPYRFLKTHGRPTP